jgi:phosphocarrier protein HPr
MKIQKTFEVTNKNGIHARPSASFVKIANQYESDIKVSFEGNEVNGKSIMGLMVLAAGPGSKIKVSAEGKDAREAIAELGELIKAGFNEE